MTIQGIAGIRDAYRKDDVARGYIDARFVEPLGALLHDRQVAALGDVIAERKPQRILEIAPGPARLTADTARVFTGQGVMVDASAQMLREAKRRLGEATSWQLIQGDAFNLPFTGQFDLVYSFRLIRHFDAADRAKLYAQVARVLKPGGLLVFDAVNEAVSKPLRERSPGDYQHFDAMLDGATLQREITAAGYKTLQLRGVQHRFHTLQMLQVFIGPRSKRLTRGLMEIVDRAPGGEPLEWIVVCQRV